MIAFKHGQLLNEKPGVNRERVVVIIAVVDVRRTTSAKKPRGAGKWRKLGIAQKSCLGDGKQTRLFLYVDECLEGSLRLMRSNSTGPVNIGSDEMVTINQLAEMVMKVAGKKVSIRDIFPARIGVRRCSWDNRLIKQKLNRAPGYPLVKGISATLCLDWEKVRDAAEKKAA